MDNLKKHKFIVFAEDHFNSLGVIRSLGEAGINPIVVLHTNKSILIKYSKYISTIHYSQSIAEGYRIIVEKYGKEEEKPFLFVSSDEVGSYLDKHYDEIKDKFYFYNAGIAGRVTQMMEKSEIVRMAEACGFRAPRSEMVKKGQLPKDLAFPILTKANTSTIYNWKSNVFICHSEPELLEAYEKITCEEVLLQEYVEKIDEFNIEGFCFDDGKAVFMPLQNRFFRTTEQSFGNYLYIDNMMPAELETKLKLLFEQTRFNGIFEVEFLIGKDGTFYFLEINFRNSAWVYAYTKCGVNFFVEYAKALLYGKLPSVQDFQLKRLPFKAMDELTDFKWSVASGKVSLLKWINELTDADCLYYYNKDDKRPFFFYLFNRLKGALHIG